MLYRFDSPLGTITYAWDGLACQRITLKGSASAKPSDDPLSRWLTAYFNQEPEVFPPLAKPATPFQKKMRKELIKVPFGEVCTYGEIARQLGTSPRAIGQALGANPLPIIIPCHRIIAADGVGGFAFGATWKRKLLDFEGGDLG